MILATIFGLCATRSRLQPPRAGATPPRSTSNWKARSQPAGSPAPAVSGRTCVTSISNMRSLGTAWHWLWSSCSVFGSAAERDARRGRHGALSLWRRRLPTMLQPIASRNPDVVPRRINEFKLLARMSARPGKPSAMATLAFERSPRHVHYISTRGEAPTLGFAEAMLAGLARDGGLYVPTAWPRFDAETIAGFAGRPYAEVAVEVIRPFVGDAIPESDLARMTREAYGRFRHPAVAPLVQFGMSDFILELFHGPTLAFKDLAMQLLSRLMDEVLTARGERTTIVVATSGDTGGAAVEAFRGRARGDLFVLFPHGRISDGQRRMLTTVARDNAHTRAIEGPFEDCQAMVKGMFNPQAFRDQLRLSGVNSINWAPILAQVVYYFTAAVALGYPRRKIAFTVPTGNFGD